MSLNTCTIPQRKVYHVGGTGAVGDHGRGIAVQRFVPDQQPAFQTAVGEGQYGDMVVQDSGQLGEQFPSVRCPLPGFVSPKDPPGHLHCYPAADD